MPKLLGITITVLLHLLVVVALLWQPTKVQEPPTAPPPPKREKFLEVRLLPPDTVDGVQNDGNTPAGGEVTQRCANGDNTYLGVGIVHNLGSGYISSVPRIYPAYKAGIREGDILVEMYRIPSTDKMHLVVERDGLNISRTIKMEQICFSEGAP